MEFALFQFGIRFNLLKLFQNQMYRCDECEHRTPSPIDGIDP
jgi:hypothetical protein